MNTELWLRLLSLAVQTAPTVIGEVQTAVHEHWGKNHVQQAVQGLDHLRNILNVVEDVAAVKSEPTMPPPAAPPPPQDLSHLTDGSTGGSRGDAPPAKLAPGVGAPDSPVAKPAPVGGKPYPESSSEK